jgi:hypothetical protein
MTQILQKQPLPNQPSQPSQPSQSKSEPKEKYDSSKHDSSLLDRYLRGSILSSFNIFFKTNLDKITKKCMETENGKLDKIADE